jgi:hypothetical protein
MAATPIGKLRFTVAGFPRHKAALVAVDWPTLTGGRYGGDQRYSLVFTEVFAALGATDRWLRVDHDPADGRVPVGLAY